MKKINKLFVAITMVFLILNFLDFLSTAIGIMSGKVVEANPIINWMGGPFSPIALIVKFIIFPIMFLLSGNLIIKKYKDSKFVLMLIGVSSTVLGFIVANNVNLLFVKAEICPKCGRKFSKEHKCLICGLEK